MKSQTVQLVHIFQFTMFTRLQTPTNTAIVTPFQETKRGPEIDRDAFELLVEDQVRAGIGITLLGTTGESPTVHDGERRLITDWVIKQVDGQVPVMLGTGSNDTRHAVQLTKMAHDQGADAALVVTPYYNKPTQSGLQEHYDAVADQGGLPVMLYDIPGRSGVGMTDETILQLSKHPHIFGLKWANGNIESLQRIVAESPTDFQVYSGDDNRTLEAMTHGADGVISVLANLCPDDVRAMIDAFQRGNINEARAIHERLLPLMEAWFCSDESPAY